MIWSTANALTLNCLYQFRLFEEINWKSGCADKHISMLHWYQNRVNTAKPKHYPILTVCYFYLDLI